MIRTVAKKMPSRKTRRAYGIREDELMANKATRATTTQTKLSDHDGDVHERQDRMLVPAEMIRLKPAPT